MCDVGDTLYDVIDTVMKPFAGAVIKVLEATGAVPTPKPKTAPGGPEDATPPPGPPPTEPIPKPPPPPDLSDPIMLARAKLARARLLMGGMSGPLDLALTPTSAPRLGGI